MVARGIRNNNPCNLRYGSNWEGMVEDSKKIDRSFCVFKDVKYGIRAACKLFLNYKRLYGIDTIQSIIDRFSPPEENDTTAYIEDVCLRLGKRRDESLDLYNADIMLELLKAIIKHENGYIPYSDSQIRQGMYLAGIN